MNEKVARALVYSLMVLCLLNGIVIVWQANIIQKQQVVIRQLWDDVKSNR